MPLSKQITGGFYVCVLIVMLFSGWTVPERPLVYDLVLVCVADILVVASAPLFWKVDLEFASVFLCIALTALMADCWQKALMSVLDGAFMMLVLGTKYRWIERSCHRSRYTLLLLANALYLTSIT